MIYITRKIHFCAAHRLYDDTRSPEENRELFGDCVNLHGHGYMLEVTFGGQPDPRTGMLMHLSELDAAIKERVIVDLDHKNLGEDVAAFADVVPTLEMMVRFVWSRVEGAVPGARLTRVRLSQDDWFFAEYFGE